jgi:hypothetical protein
VLLRVLGIQRSQRQRHRRRRRRRRRAAGTGLGVTVAVEHDELDAWGQQHHGRDEHRQQHLPSTAASGPAQLGVLARRGNRASPLIASLVPLSELSSARRLTQRVSVSFAVCGVDGERCCRAVSSSYTPNAAAAALTHATQGSHGWIRSPDLSHGLAGCQRALTQISQ